MFLNPSKVVDKLDIRPQMKVAEFGCGAGHFSIEMAKKVGSMGTVYAFDVKKEALEALHGLAETQNIFNIETGRVDLEAEKGSRLNNNLLDFVLFSNVLFQVENKKAIIEEAFRILKQGGRAAIIEWSPFGVGSSLGPPKEARVDKENITDIFTDIGFEKQRDFDAGESHYGLMFSKP